MNEKEINLGYLKNDKESIRKLEYAINNFRSKIFQTFIENPRDVEFRGVEGDVLVGVYIKGQFSRYITPEERRELTDYYDGKISGGTIIAEIQPKSIDNDVFVVQVMRNDKKD